MGLDDYLGYVSSYTSFAYVGNYPGSFLSQVNEDTNNLAYIAEEDLSVACDGNTLKFKLSHTPYMQDGSSGDLLPCTNPANLLVLLNGTRTVVKSVDPLNKTFYLPSSPLAGSSVVVRYAHRNIVSQGYYFLELTEVKPDKKAEIFVGSFEAVEKQPISFAYKKVRIYVSPTFFLSNSVKLYVDGIVLPPDAYSVNKLTGIIEFLRRPLGNLLQIRDKHNVLLESVTHWKVLNSSESVLIENAAGNEKHSYIPYATYASIDLYSNNVKLIQRKSSSHRAYDYYIKDRVIYLRQPLPRGSNLSIKVTYYGTDVASSVSLDALFGDASTYTLPSNLQLLEDFFEVYENDNLLTNTDYNVNYTTNKITFLKVPSVSATYAVSYRISKGTSGPYPVSANSQRNDILPGVILHFNNQFKATDKVVVLVGDQRKACADEYGGKWQFNVELVTICPDPLSSEDLTDKLGAFISAILKPRFDALGMFISPEVSIGGDANEERDDATNDVDFQNTISFSVMTDWYMRIPRKFRMLSFATHAQPLTQAIDATLDDYQFYPKFADGQSYLMDSVERL